MGLSGLDTAELGSLRKFAYIAHPCEVVLANMSTHLLMDVQTGVLDFVMTCLPRELDILSVLS